MIGAARVDVRILNVVLHRDGRPLPATEATNVVLWAVEAAGYQEEPDPVAGTGRRPCQVVVTDAPMVGGVVDVEAAARRLVTEWRLAGCPRTWPG